MRREYETVSLFEKHPPKLTDPNKRAVLELAMSGGVARSPPVTVTRWSPLSLPESVTSSAMELEVVEGTYAYGHASDGVWHVNFADLRLFVAYGSPLLAQDELQVAEHPVLGSIREALLDEGEPAVTEENDQPTPVLIAGAERRCALHTELGLYGSQFARASRELLTRAVEVLSPPTYTNLIAMAAPVGGPGPYWRRQLEAALRTAFTAFSAACTFSAERWPSTPVEIRTGFWGCGAFGGNRRTMTLLQLLAARLANVARVRFFAVDEVGATDFQRGAADLEAVLSAGRPGEPLDALIDRVEDLDYEWGVGNGT